MITLLQKVSFFSLCLSVSSMANVCRYSQLYIQLQEPPYSKDVPTRGVVLTLIRKVQNSRYPLREMSYNFRVHDTLYTPHDEN